MNYRLSVKWGLLVLACVLVLTACSKSGGNTPKTNEPAGNAAANQTSDAAPQNAEGAEEQQPATKGDPVKLIWYTIGTPQPDQKAVTDKVNEYLLEKLNVTVDIRTLDWGDYDPKMNAAMAAREEFDLAFGTNAWVLAYQPNIDKGAFMPLDDLIEKYAQDAKSAIPDKFWPDLLANDGKVYMFPNYQVAARKRGFIVNKDIADKYGFDPSTVQTYKDMEPFFQTLREKDPTIIPYGTGGSQDTFFTNPNIERGPVGVRKGDASNHIVTMVEYLQDPATVEYYKTMRDWYKKGYINKDAATLKDFGPKLKKGNIFAVADSVMKPGGEVAYKENSGGHPGVYVPLESAIFTGIKDGGTIISATSKHPEQAMQLINLVNTDPYLYNLLCFGIEGVHYTKQGNYAIPVQDSKYNPNTDWVFGNQFNGLLREGQPEDVWEQTKALNESAEVPLSYGFKFNNENVKTEEANVSAVYQEFNNSLEKGIVEPDSVIPKYIEKLKEAGVEKIDAERQKQFDAFLAAKKAG